MDIQAIDIGDFFIWNNLFECLEPLSVDGIVSETQFKLKSDKKIRNLLNREDFFEFKPDKPINYCCFIVPFSTMNCQYFSISSRYISLQDFEDLNNFNSNYFVITNKNDTEMRLIDIGEDIFFLSSTIENWVFNLVDFSQFVSYHNCYTTASQGDFVEGLKEYVKDRGMKEVTTL